MIENAEKWPENSCLSFIWGGNFVVFIACAWGKNRDV